jgi:hypothetical protein
MNSYYRWISAAHIRVWYLEWTPNGWKWVDQLAFVD